MTATVMTDAIRRYLADADQTSLQVMLAKEHPADIVAFIGPFDEAEIATILKLLPGHKAGQVFGYFPPQLQLALARRLPRSELARLVTDMSHDERADLFNRLSPEQREALLPALAHAEREDIRKLASYAEGTAGSLATSDYAALGPDLTVAEAVEVLRREAPDKETIYEAYVVDSDRRLIGAVSLRDLILAAPEATVASVMTRDVIFARADDPRDAVARKIRDYDLLALPIVNGDEKLIGIVTQDDAMDVVEEAATGLFQKHAPLAGNIPSLRDAGVWALYRARIVWLVVLVFGNIFSGAGIAAFEDTIAAYLALVFFLPLLVDSGGNAGSQAATLMVRALATGDVRMADWTRMIGREVVIAGALGLTMALAVSTIGIVRGGPDIAMVVAMAMILIVITGSLIGMSLPFLLTRFGLDPATASAPLITSIADAAGVLIYFAIATAFLPLPS
jgi:magnesium transporter